MKKIAIFGSTGSIGSSLLKIIKADQKNFKIELLTANKNYKKLIKSGAKYIAISSFIWDNPKLKPELAIRKFK